jgi:hypothetical protein
MAAGPWTTISRPGFYHPEKGTIFHPAPSPYGIPLSTLYSRNIANLFCAGRNHSATHCAMSSTRVMATCSLMGQAVGTAASIAVRDGLTPREVRNTRIKEVQQTLMDDDCWIPWHTREIPELSRNATLHAPEGDAEALRNGVDRKVGDASETAGQGQPARRSRTPSRPRCPLRKHASSSTATLTAAIATCGLIIRWMPRRGPYLETITKAFRIEAQQTDGSWQTVHTESNNYQRLVRIPLQVETTGIRLVPESTWG